MLEIADLLNLNVKKQPNGMISVSIQIQSDGLEFVEASQVNHGDT